MAFDPGYWTPRLIHRKYTETLHPDAHRELSVRIEFAGTSHYFPLGTHLRRRAAQRAARIYQSIVREGWSIANTKFPRELSVALRWADNPVAWTYATIHTSVAPRGLSHSTAAQRQAELKVAIAEADPGVRQALAWCVNQQQGCCCLAAFSSAAEALREIPRQPVHLFLLSQTLPENSAHLFLEQLKVVAPKVTPLLFSIYEDADQLFKSAPGGASGYLFRRTPPTRLLEPIADAWDTRSREKIAKSVRHYFEQAAASLPFGGSADLLHNLTAREHEILALLGKGHPDKEIADLLRISTWTVHGHLKKIFEKLGAHNRTDAVVKYLHK
jgi:DNA-binding NarL/FixJ family response regulator